MRTKEFKFTKASLILIENLVVLPTLERELGFIGLVVGVTITF